MDSTLSHERNPFRWTSQCPNPKRTSVGMNRGSSSSSRRGILASWFTVPTRPGLMQLTRIECGERSKAMARVMPSNAAFAEQYALMFGIACCARTEPIFTMTPAACMCRARETGTQGSQCGPGPGHDKRGLLKARGGNGFT